MCNSCSDNDKGCTIYETRPESCVNFNCNFIEDNLHISLRPDKTNIIFEKVMTKIYVGLIDSEYVDDWQSEMVKHNNNLYMQKIKGQGLFKGTETILKRLNISLNIKVI